MTNNNREYSTTGKKRVIALGFFDGIHVGHSALMRKVIAISKEKALVPSVITFDTHPLSLVSGHAVPMINSPEDRAGLIHRVFGIEDIIFLHFDRETACMPWDEFIDHLVDEFGARHLVAGHDFRFGCGGQGNSDLLSQKCGELGVGCDVIPEVKLDGVVCSSTYVRELIATGAIERANSFLGHPHVLTDVVRYGYRLGRTLGTPTINMCFGEGVLVPPFGVYATKVFLDSSAEYTGNPNGYIGVTNVGVRPTVDNSGIVTAETHILDFRGNLYGHQVRVEFHSLLRPEIKFKDKDELKAQILSDCGQARQYFAKNIL